MHQDLSSSHLLLEPQGGGVEFQRLTDPENFASLVNTLRSQINGGGEDGGIYGNLWLKVIIRGLE